MVSEDPPLLVPPTSLCVVWETRWLLGEREGISERLGLCDERLRYTGQERDSFILPFRLTATLPSREMKDVDIDFLVFLPSTMLSCSPVAEERPLSILLFFLQSKLKIIEY